MHQEVQCASMLAEKSVVLILIVVDDGLVRIDVYPSKEKTHVLILIVVDDGLVQDFDRKYYTVMTKS